MALYEKQEDNERQCERNEADNRQESFVKQLWYITSSFGLLMEKE